MAKEKEEKMTVEEVVKKTKHGGLLVTLGILGGLGIVVVGSALEATTTPLNQAVPLEKKLFPPGGLPSLPTPKPIEVFDPGQCSDVSNLQADFVAFTAIMGARALPLAKIVYIDRSESEVFMSCPPREDGTIFFGVVNKGGCSTLLSIVTQGAVLVCSTPKP